MKVQLRFIVIFAAILSVLGCTEWKHQQVPGEIPFILTGVDESSCPINVNIGQDKWQLDYFGFYLTNPEVRIDGKWQSVKFKKNAWQTPSTALVRFDSLCSAPERSNTAIQLDVSDKFMKLATNFRFTMGLPLNENHAALHTLPAPLNNKDMYMNRQNGHMFMRLDLSQTGNQSNHWSYYLGSAGCEAESLEHSPQKSCAFTNRVEVILPMNQLDEELELDVSVSNIVSQVNLLEGGDCKFDSPEKQPCKKLLRNLLHRPWIKWH